MNDPTVSASPDELRRKVDDKIDEILHAMEKQPPEDRARWLEIIRKGNLDIELAEDIDKAITHIEYGSIKLKINRHEVVEVSQTAKSRHKRYRGKHLSPSKDH